MTKIMTKALLGFCNFYLERTLSRSFSRFDFIIDSPFSRLRSEVGGGGGGGGGSGGDGGGNNGGGSGVSGDGDGGDGGGGSDANKTFLTIRSL